MGRPPWAPLRRAEQPRLTSTFLLFFSHASHRCNTVRQIRQRGDGQSGGTPDQLARAVRQELLDTDLAKLVPASYTRLNAHTLSSVADKVGDVGRGAVLVQIESMIDIGYSISTQLEIAEARREARRANVDPNDALAEAKTTATSEADHMADFQAQEDDKVQATTVYPRRMLKLELSDGSKGPSVFAIELERIRELDMNTTRIGTKLLLRGVAVKGGNCLMMTPQTVSVEGGCVQEKDQRAEDRFIDMLRARLGKPPQNETSAEGVRDTPMTTKAVSHPANGTATVQRGFSPDDDESELLAALEAEEEMLAAGSSSASMHANATRLQSTTDSSLTSAPPPPPPAAAVCQRATLVVPESLTQSSTGKSQSQRSDAALKASATQQDPISLIDSDDDEEMFASIPDAFPVQQTHGRHNNTASTVLRNTREEPIVIESSPEP